MDSPHGGISPPTERTRPPKKPYKELNLAEKVELIRMAEDNAGLSQASIAERYSIAKSNVCRILQRKGEYLAAFESAGFAGSRKRKLKPRQEEERKEEEEEDSLPSHTIRVPIPRRPYEDHGNETLRAHMYKQHEISRMFMCRCCNWAFPDKTSLHVHIQAKEEAKGGPKTLSPTLSSSISSAFAPLPTLSPSALHSALAARSVLGCPPPLPLFGSSPSLPSAPLSEDLLARLRYLPSLDGEESPPFSERLLLTQMLSGGGAFSALGGWMGHAALPTGMFGGTSTSEQAMHNSPSSDAATKAEDEDEDEVEVKEDEDIKPPLVATDSLEGDKRPESVCVSGSSTEGFSPCRASRLSSSPIDTSKILPPPSAFHTLNLDASSVSSFSGMAHVSPSESHSTASPQGDSSSHSGSCFDCAVLRTKALSVENKATFLEGRNAALERELSMALSSSRQAEATSIALRTALLQCQEEALRFARSEDATEPQSVMRFLNHILQATLIR